MTIESDEGDVTIHVISGLPTFAAADRLEAMIRAEAGVAPGEEQRTPRSSPTVFHLAVSRRGVPLGVASSTIGALPDLPLGLALRAAGVDVRADAPLADPCCELVSLAVDPAGEGIGIPEALYRSFYRRARTAARSVAIGLDPWLLDVLREQYGVPFRVLGPPIDLLGRELLPVGGDLVELEAGVAVAAPAFHAFLTAPERRPASDDVIDLDASEAPTPR